MRKCIRGCVCLLMTLVTVSLADNSTEDNTQILSEVENKFLENVVKQAQMQVDLAVEKTIKELKRVKRSAPSGHELFQNNRFPLASTLPLAKAAEVYEQTIETLLRKVNSGVYFNVSDEELTYEDLLKPKQLKRLSNLSGCAEHRRVVDTCKNFCFNFKYRTFDGTCNNFFTPMVGSSNSPLTRLLPPRYENNFNLPIGWTRNKMINGFKIPSARKISLDLISSNKATSDNQLSHMFMQWGQFLDHDITATPAAVSNARFSDGRFCSETCNFQSPCFPITVDADDPRITLRPCLGFVRSSSMCGSGVTSQIFQQNAIHRQQINAITSFIDASQVYGSSEDEASHLRNLKNDNGLLRVGVKSKYNNKKRLLPDVKGSSKDFVAGDHRVNEQLGLTSLHTIWFREHNRLARQLKKVNPNLDGESIYQEARKIIGGKIQHITYKHWLPKVLGPSGMHKMGTYQGYQHNVDPSIANAFSTAAFRFGHTLIKPVLNRLDANFDPIPEGNIILHKAFFAPERIIDEGGIDPILRGLFATPSKKKTPSDIMNEELTERLFKLLHEVALDLAAFNIQRGRDHGLPSYNSFRKFCGLREAVTFDDFSREISSKMVRRKLKDLYGHPDNVDLSVGGSVEDAVKGGRVGETWSCILINQFKKLRDGDRLWYEKKGVFTKAQLVQIKRSSLSRVICDNSDGIEDVQKDIFRLVKQNPKLLKCSSKKIKSFNIKPWTKCCKVCPAQQNLFTQ